MTPESIKKFVAGIHDRHGAEGVSSLRYCAYQYLIDPDDHTKNLLLKDPENAEWAWLVYMAIEDLGLWDVRDFKSEIKQHKHSKQKLNGCKIPLVINGVKI